MTAGNRARLIAARRKLGLSRRQMAAKLPIARITYEQWETGTRRVPGGAVLAAEALAKIRRAKSKAIPNSAAAAIRRLADGKRTAAEVAAAAGISIARVYEAVRGAKKAGRPLKFSRSSGKRQPRTRRTDETIRRLADGKRTASEVAAAAGISVSRVYQAAHAAKKVGRPLQFTRSAGSEAQTSRNAAIADAILQGSTLQEQGDKYGISRQAVQQIALRHGVHASALRKIESTRRARLAAQERDRVKRDRQSEKLRRDKPLIEMKLSGLTYKEISARAGLSIGTLTKIFRANNLTQPSVKLDPATRIVIARRWRDGEDARQLAAEFNMSAEYVKMLANKLGFHRRAASSREKQTNA